MSTEISTIAAAVQDDLRGQLVSGFISDNDLAMIVGAALSKIRAMMPNYVSWAISGRSSNRVVPTSTVDATIDVDDEWGGLIRAMSLWIIANGGMMIRAEDNLGSYSSASHSANMTSRVVQHRLNAAVCWAQVEQQMMMIKNMDQFGTADVDFTLADW